VEKVEVPPGKFLMSVQDNGKIRAYRSIQSIQSAGSVVRVLRVASRWGQVDMQRLIKGGNKSNQRSAHALGLSHEWHHTLSLSNFGHWP